ncbi:nucleotidyltransferase domain-containing protein [Candidatus Woesearchaeota archaeon]|nr:nucleotidyltransferase domain-containing protein [Candidatus Woesearchaeota archaeon]
MEFKQLAVKEQIIKRVVQSGNGGAVWVPKSWLGQEVVVILPQKPKLDLKERVIHLLEPYLKDILSVFIYGSYARHEATKESDIDIMILTNKELKISINEPNIELTVFPLEKFKKAVEKHPVVYYQMVQEAEPLVNGHVLEELKNIKIENKNFKGYIIETKEQIKSSKDLLELDKLDGEFIKSYSAIYSIILRLRGVFIMKCILHKERFSNKNFNAWILKNEIPNQEFERCYLAYRSVRDKKSNKSIKIKINIAEKLLDILIREADLIESRI